MWSAPDPSNWTPHVVDGSVKALLRVGDTLIVGGTFSQVRDDESNVILDRANIFALNARTGRISTTFTPSTDGEVSSLVASEDGQSVYVGGEFANVNGVRSKSLARST